MNRFEPVINYIKPMLASFNMAASDRFALPVSDSAELKLRKDAVPIKTTDWGIKLWTEWASTRENIPGKVSPTTPLLEMPTEDFAYLLAKFVLEVRKENGCEYLPKTLYGL